MGAPWVKNNQKEVGKEVGGVTTMWFQICSYKALEEINDCDIYLMIDKWYKIVFRHSPTH